MGFPKQILCLLLVLFLSTQIDSSRTKRMFALCPPHFIRIGNECYFISQNRVNWLDAHFECLDRNSRLAEPYKQEDRFLRKYLNHLRDFRPSEVWIGARFNWERNKWQWGHNGMDLTYQSFSQMSADTKDLKFHCAIMKPNLKYRWSASSCEQQHQYICQHRMPYVNEKNRQKIYNKWNETYPNEMANEIEVVLSEDDLLRNRRRKMHRSHMRANNRQIKNESNHRQRNDIHFNHFPQPDQIQNRKIRMGGNRPRNQAIHRRFEINRNRANCIRQRIQFNSTNTANSRQFNRNRAWRQHHQRPNIAMNSANTIKPNTYIPNVSRTTLRMWTPTTTTTMRTTTTPMTTTTASTTTTTTTTTSTSPPMVISNDVTQIEDNQFQRQIEEAEQRAYDEKLRRKQELMEQERRMERERSENEERMRAIHQMELDRRHQEIINEKQYALEQQQIQDEKRRQDSERRKQDEMNRQRYEEAKNRQAELRRQRENQSSQQRAIQTNEIVENTVVTTMSPVDKKKLKLKRLHDRLSKLSPEEQEMFYKKRAERNKKRGVENQLE